MLRAPLAWLGPNELVRDAAVAVEGGVLTYAGPAARSPSAEDIVEVDGFLMPAVADRHVHIRLSDPAAVLMGGVTAVRDLAWPADDIFALADASEMPSFNGPVIRAAGPMLTAPGATPPRTGGLRPAPGSRSTAPRTRRERLPRWPIAVPLRSRSR